MTLTMACPDDDSVNFASANAYEARFDGSDLRGANFANALLSNASFGKGEDGRWANVEGAEFEGALLSVRATRESCVRTRRWTSRGRSRWADVDRGAADADASHCG